MELRSVKNLRKISETSARLLGGESSIDLMLILSVVAEHEALGKELDVGGVEVATGLGHSSTSRNLAALSQWHRLQRPGLGLVEMQSDPKDRRRKIVVLTAKGKQAIRELTGVL